MSPQLRRPCRRFKSYHRASYSELLAQVGAAAGGNYTMERVWQFVTIALTLVAIATPALAQTTQPPATNQPPVIPPVVVEATPGGGPVIEDSGLTGTILDGTIFSSPP